MNHISNFKLPVKELVLEPGPHGPGVTVTMPRPIPKSALRVKPRSESDTGGRPGRLAPSG